MAGEAWPIDASAGAPSYTGAELRHLDASLLLNGTADAFGARGGRRPGAGMVVTASALAWSVTAGGFIAYPRFSGSQGPYRVDFAATEAGSYTAPHASLTRYDILQVVIDDAGVGDGSGARQARIVYKVNPTPGSATLPTLDARANLLATLIVPAAGSPTVLMGPVAVASGGILPILASERAALTQHDGLTVVEVDTKKIWASFGGSWTKVSQPSFFGSTSAVYPVGGSVPAGADLRIETVNTVITTIGTGEFNVPFPVALTGVAGVSFINGDMSSGAIMFALNATTQSSTAVNGKAFDSAGIAMASVGMRIVAIIVGWTA